MKRADGGHRLLVAVAVLIVLVVIADFVLQQSNRSIQAEVNQRQLFINQSINLDRVNAALIRNIAVAAVKEKDAKLGQILADEGIKVNVSPGSSSAAPEAAAPAEEPRDSARRPKK